MLSQAEDLLTVVGFEPLLEPIVTIASRREIAWSRPMVGSFGEKLFTCIGSDERETAHVISPHLQHTVSCDQRAVTLRHGERNIRDSDESVRNIALNSELSALHSKRIRSLRR